MKLRLCFSPALAATLFMLITSTCGCGTSYVVAPTKEGGDFSYSDFNSELSGQRVFIVLKDGREFEASQIQLISDSVSWVEHVTQPNPNALIPRIHVGDVSHRVPLGDVERTVRKNTLLGGLEGLGLGLVGGGFLGMAIGSGQSGSKSDLSPLLGMITGGVIGGVGGLVTGVILGHSYEYSFAIPDSTLRASH